MRVKLLLLILSLYGISCGPVYTPTQAEPTHPNEAYFIERVQHYCEVLEHGTCYVEFHEEPNGGWMAAWATPGGHTVHAWRKNIHDQNEPYLRELAGHETCHLGGCREKYGCPGCWTEAETNECMSELVYGGK